MQMLLYGLLTCYLIAMPILFFNWYDLYQHESQMTHAERQISRMVLGIATLLWPIVLPLSYLELIRKVKRYEQQDRRLKPEFTAISEVY
jgi:hypothetical protein